MNQPATCELAMLDCLRHQQGHGTFEAHVTVEASDLPQRERFQAVCAELGVKCVLIELPHGVTRSQPMTSSYHRGDLASVVSEVACLAGDLRQRGFAIRRLKLEAVVTNDGVPGTDEEARTFPPGNYFEFHVKVTLSGTEALDSVRESCHRHGAHLSANARDHDGEGAARRFVTLRVYGVGRIAAEERFEALCRDLAGRGHPLTNRLREYTLYDSNVHVDAGWIDPPAGVGNAGGGDRG